MDEPVAVTEAARTQSSRPTPPHLIPALGLSRAPHGGAARRADGSRVVDYACHRLAAMTTLERHRRALAAEAAASKASQLTATKGDERTNHTIGE